MPSGPSWLSIRVACAPSSATTSERVNVADAVSDPKAKTRWIGRSSLASRSMRTRAPSPMNAVLSATATSSVGTMAPSRLATSGSLSANAFAIGAMDSPGSSATRSESSATKAPSTKVIRRAPMPASSAPAPFARRFARASGTAASGFASRISARRSVYFHSSTRRCGRPSASKASNAAARRSAMRQSPGSFARTAANASASAVSAAVFIGLISGRITIFAGSGRLGLVFGVAARLQLQRQILAAGLHDPALGEHVHHVGHDVVEQTLVVRDHDRGAVGRTQPVDAVGDDFQCVDVEPRIGLVEHAKLGLKQRHLQDFVALLLAAGKADVDRPAQHLRLDSEPLRDLPYPLHELRGGKLRLAALLALGVDRGAQERHAGDAGDLQRILERQEQALGGAL